MEPIDVKKLEEHITHIEDILEIQKLQHTYQQWNALFRGDKLLELFTHKASDVSVEAGAPGVYEGYEAVKGFYDGYNQMSEVKGVLIEHYAICPVIEVAKDGKTAKGTWFSPGLAGIGYANKQNWGWGKYSCDYIKEDGTWKIWHLRWYPTFIAPYDKGWLYQEESPPVDADTPPVIDHGQPNKPITYRKPYDPSGTNYILPEPPKPYDTWEK